MLQGLQILRKVLQGTQHSTLMQAVITEAIFEKTAGKTITIDPEYRDWTKVDWYDGADWKEFFPDAVELISPGALDVCK